MEERTTARHTRSSDKTQSKWAKQVCPAIHPKNQILPENSNLLSSRRSNSKPNLKRPTQSNQILYHQPKCLRKWSLYMSKRIKSSLPNQNPCKKSCRALTLIPKFKPFSTIAWKKTKNKFNYKTKNHQHSYLALKRPQLLMDATNKDKRSYNSWLTNQVTTRIYSNSSVMLVKP